MKIQISNIEIDSTFSDFDDVFDYGDILEVAFSNVKQQVRMEIERRVKEEFYTLPIVQEFAKKKAEELAEGLQINMEES